MRPPKMTQVTFWATPVTVKPPPAPRRRRTILVGSLRPKKKAQKLLPVIGMHFEKPISRSDCVDAERPCPWVSCRYHMAHRLGSGHANRPTVRDGSEDPHLDILDPDKWATELPVSCMLDITDRGLPVSADECSEVMGISAHQVRKIAAKAVGRMKAMLRKELDTGS